MIPDTAFSIAFDMNAPAPERYDAQAEIQKAHAPRSSNSLIPSEHVRQFIDYMQAHREAHDDFLKAHEFPGRVIPPPKVGPRSVMLNHQQITVSGQFYEKPGPLGFDALRTIVARTPMLSSIILTRQRQVSRFCQPSDDGKLGFEICLKDPKAQRTPDDEAFIQRMTRFFTNCGDETNPRARKRLKRSNFAQLMMKSVEDTLTMDSNPIETEFKRDRSRGLSGIYAIDGSTIRLCTEEGYEGDDEVIAVQVVDGVPMAAYTHDNLIYEVRNPSSSVMRGGYGMSETELLVQVVTGYLNAMQTNIDGFNKNSIPRGILTLIGEYGDDELKSFKRYWNQMLRGADNRWGLPVLVSKDKNGVANWQNLGIEYDEMMFSKWMTFLTSIGCAIYGMDPSEINFESFSAGRSSLSGSDTEEKLANSKDKGLRPLLSHYESVWSDFVVAEEDDRFGFRWVGLDPEDPQQLLDKQKQTMTVDELRAAMGQQKHPVPLVGNAPLNPSHIPLYQQAMQPQQPDAPPPEPEDYGEEDLDEGSGDGGGPPGPDGGQPAAEDFGGNGGGAPADPGGYGEGGAEGSSFGKAMLSILEVEE